MLAAIGTRLPVACRLALRDLARHQARSSDALAAIGVALAISTAIVVAARVHEQTAIPLDIAIDPVEAPHADADGGRIVRLPVGRQTGPGR